MVAAVTEAIRASHGDDEHGADARHDACLANGIHSRRRVDPDRIAERLDRAGWKDLERSLVALAAHTTIASSSTDDDAAWTASTVARIGDEDLLLETAGVVFAFNTINRIANARRVQLEYRFVRGLKPIRGWVERRLASLTRLAYDLSFRHQARHSADKLLDRLSAVFELLGVPDVPAVFHWLSQSPAVLEGIVELLEANVTSSAVRIDLLKEAAAIAVASRAAPGSGLKQAVDDWLPAGPSSSDRESTLASACRRYAWLVANASHTISDEQIAAMSALGLDDAERLDLALVVSIFSALAIIEPISAAAAAKAGRRRRSPPSGLEREASGMSRPQGSFLRRATWLAAAAIVVGLYFMTRERALSQAESEDIVNTFRFSRTSLPEVKDHPPYKYVRNVHPSVQHIRAYVSTLGASVALGDLDGDGRQNDVVWVDPRTDQVICGPVPGTGARFEPFALDPGASFPHWDPATMCPTGVLIADLNEDGLMDVLVVYWGRSPIVYLRKTPTDPKAPPSAAEFEAHELIEGGDRWYSTTAATADLDGDGHCDLIIGNYLPDGSRMLDASAEGSETLHDSLARSGNGGGLRFFKFASATSGRRPTVRFDLQNDVIPEELTHGWTYAIGPADLDGDLLPELYIANDFGPDRLLHNRSTPGHFRFAPLHGERTADMPASFVMNQDSFKGMGVDFGDINGDGLLDIFVSNLTTKFGLTESHFLWLNTGKTERMKEGLSPFRQASEEFGLSRSGWSWDCRLADFNNDGVLEVLQANGFIKGTVNKWPELQSLGTSNSQLLNNPKFWPSLQPGDDVSGHDTFAFFVRASDGRYYDAAPKLKLQDGQSMSEAMVTRGIALADVDGDGRLDFALANQWQPSYFYHNECPKPGNFMGLHLLLPLEKGKPTLVEAGIGHSVAEIPGRPAIGAAVTMRMPDGSRRVAQVDGGTGFAGKRAPDVHLGLGTVTEAPVEIHWRDPDGHPHEETFTLKAGWHTIRLAWPGDKK